MVVYAFTKEMDKHRDDEYKSEDVDVSVHFIDVGQADCAVIKSPYGNILIDAGFYENVSDTIEYINSLGIEEFEYAIFTHPHSDHIGGASELLDTYKFTNVIMPDAVSVSYSYEKMLESLEKENCDIIEGEFGKTFVLGEELKIELLAPVKDYSSIPDELNNTSVVARISYGEVSFLFTGDAEISSELDMLYNDLPKLNADILKVGHHGSSTSSCEDFLYSVSPDVAIISAGENNDYGHPHREVVKGLQKIGAKMYVTYEVGNIVVTTDGKTYSIITEKQKS